MSTTLSQLQEALDNNTRLFLDILDTISPERIHQRPPQSDWSIMECAEHVMMIEEDIANTLHGPVRPIANRAPDSKLPQIQASLLEFTQRLRVVRPVRPEDNHPDIRTFSEAFRHNRNKIKAALADGNLDDECTGHEHPIFGMLTKKEWAYFLIFHTERHLQQINRLETLLS
ncbi:DinB family protein [Chitinophaga pendula]|uniref:DinB family protein n=1 Tax=Chitinophaga TaxID=79328 RepID=UPI000BAF20F0|nr:MULTISPECIES: DinB family protein [Chitinophaga]ASZ14380.1 hypothetical protein CK934_27260 [Chitinophaga sp. MD30]UCJ07968.1 DinB family protein [Chitinophaga pendula]